MKIFKCKNCGETQAESTEPKKCAKCGREGTMQQEETGCCSCKC